MKESYKNIALLIVFVILSAGLQAQVNGWQEAKATADSSQRVWMRQALKIDDSVITKVFSTRDKLYQRVAEIRNDLSLSAEEQSSRVTVLRADTENAIRSILGEETFKIYTDKIRERLQRAGRSDQKPLAGTND